MPGLPGLAADGGANLGPALSSPTSAKRKASDSVEIDNFENVDPLLYSKRTKATDSFFSSAGSLAKPGAFFVLTKAHSTPSLATRDATLSAAAGLGSPVKAAAPRPRGPSPAQVARRQA